MEVLSYQNGLQYDSKYKTLLKYDYVNNHFLSLYVPRVDNTINHILQFNYDEIDKDILENQMSKIVLDKTPSLWVEIITELNYGNRTKWRFQKVLLPKLYGEEYKLLGLWKGNVSYLCRIVSGGGAVFINRGKGLVLRLKRIFK
ncbi:MAG: hypothetical protein HFH25_02935 [Lachnospiraceae bacterium]|nr:hypothetical protein [Lachnospiraceae bacterium]